MEITEYNFIEVGNYGYRFEEVEVNHPMQNVAGYTRINGKYYKKIYPTELNSNQVSSERDRFIGQGLGSLNLR